MSNRGEMIKSFKMSIKIGETPIIYDKDSIVELLDYDNVYIKSFR